MGETKMEQTAETKSPRLWLRIVLFLSLALNLAVVGVAVGVFARFGPHKDAHPPRGDQVSGVYTHALTAQDRRRIGREMFRNQRNTLPSRQEMAADYAAMVATLRVQPFDADAAGAILHRQIEFGQRRAELGHGLLLQRLTEMSPEERAAYADRLENALRQRFSGGSDHEPRGKGSHFGPGHWFMRPGG